MIEVVEQINSVERRVGSRTFDAGEARTVVITRTYDSALEDVWDACSNPERIPRWFLPVSGELRAGGRYQLEGNAGGRVERCDPPRGFDATWEFAGHVSWIELRLSEAGSGRTRFELSHIAPTADEHWAQFGPGAVGVGWELALAGLARHLASGAPLDPTAAAAWTVSEEGREFVRLSSRRWCHAAIEGGADRAWARAAAERTMRFYTGDVA
ncbi:MAG TPA: SRPBCC family protein [Solirubrobacteraceae bacterium]|nr:SRPBCC family protein [Solirubrobacteraceae bacterium]